MKHAIFAILINNIRFYNSELMSQVYINLTCHQTADVTDSDTCNNFINVNE